MRRFGKIFIICCLIVVVGVLGIGVGIQIEREENRRVEILRNFLQELTATAQRTVPLVEGDWKKFHDLGWAFMPTGGKTWSYWRDKDPEVMFFTFFDLALHCPITMEVCGGEGNIRPFQYRRAYAYEPLPLGFASGGIAQAIAKEEGKVWIKERSPGRLILRGETTPMLWRKPVRISAEVFNSALDELAASSDAFYWKSYGRWEIRLATERDG